MLEMVIVIIVVGILAVNVIPAWNSLTGTRQAAAAEEVERRLLTARSFAMSQGQPMGLRIDPTNDTLQLYTIATFGAAPSIAVNFDGQPDTAAALKPAYPGSDITALSGGNAATGTQTLWFSFEGAPELRNASGTLLGPWTTNASVTLAGGYTVTVYKNSGMVSR